MSNENAEKGDFDGVAFDTSVASVWESDSQVMLVLTDVFLSKNKSVCALPQICFTSTDKYTLHGPTNISAFSDKYTSK